MTHATPQPTKQPRRKYKWAPLLAITLVLVLIAALVLLAMLTRRLASDSEVWLHIAPAAATVDDKTTISLSSGGWRRGEQVAICILAADNRVCSADGALLVEVADANGNVNTEVQAGTQLAAGRSTFILTGLESSRRVSRTFRVLRAPGTPLAPAIAAIPPVSDLEAGLTPILGAQASDPLGLDAGGAWLAEYFANPDLAGQPEVVREENALTFDWGVGSPSPELPVDGFSARWTRRLSLPDLNYRFVLQADGGVRLFVGNVLLIDRWQDEGEVTTSSASIELAPGEHDVRVEYFDERGNASVALRWEAIEQFPDWRGEYFANPDLAGPPALVRNDPDPSFDWGMQSPAPGVIPADGFSVRWTRTLDFAPGVYRFILTAQDGGRLLVEGQPVIDAWQGAAAETRVADQALSGGQYQIVVHLRNEVGPARIAVGWSPLPTPTPIQVAGAEPTASPGVTPTPEPTPTPGGPPTETPSLVNGSPTATATATATSSVTANAAETASPTATFTPESPTATPTMVMPPGALVQSIEVSPSSGPLGQRIRINSVNWTPGTLVRVSLSEFGKPYSEADIVSGVSFTTPTDSSLPWSFEFTFPNDSQWTTRAQPVQVWVHSSEWTEWAQGVFRVQAP